MIRNGLCLYESNALDGVEGGGKGFVVLRDGSLLGGVSFFYFSGTYSCSGGKWKGEITQREHTPAPLTFATAGRIVTAGFTGTYTDESAEFEATVLGQEKPSIPCNYAAVGSGLNRRPFMAPPDIPGRSDDVRCSG
jgi:hypothetical protein